jgi:UDP-N-acetylmuramoyl-L-alanyl-D-glutamate--2,6-diaminopimelate ligase
MHSTSVDRGIVSLRQVLPKARFVRGGDILATSCSADWRACQQGDVYFALVTADEDGHDRARCALDRGAAAIVAERLLPLEVPQVLVPDSRSAMARVCQALAGSPSRHLRTIGITGSAGKTTTAMLMASILEAAGEPTGVMSSLGHSDSLTQCLPTTTVPTTAEFASWLGRMRVAGCTSAVLEVASQALAQRRVSGIELDAALLTNLHGGQLAQHNSAAACQKINRRVFRMLKPGGVAIVNADDHRCRNLLSHVKTPCLTYGLHAEADVTASVIDRCPSEQTFLLSLGSDTAPVRTRIIGDFHVSNCLAVTAAAAALGYNLETIVRGLEAVERLPGRMQRLECGQPFSVYIDAASTAETLSQAVRAVRQVTAGRVLVVFGAGETGDSARRALLGRILERAAHKAILTRDEPGSTAPLAALHEVLDGFERPQRAHFIPNRRAAIEFALSQARPGDSILLAGRSERLNLQAASGDDEDRKTACNWLYQQPASQPPTARFRIVG